MSSVIEFLEKMGSEAQWREASQSDVEIALAEAQIEAPFCEAILTRDTSKLEALLQKTPLFSIMVPGAPDEEEEEGEEDEDDDAGEKPKPKGARDSLAQSSFVQA